MSNARHKNPPGHRRRPRDSGVVRVAVQVPAIDAALLRGLAAVLRGDAMAAGAVRAQLLSVVTGSGTANVLDMFGSDLPDVYFDGVFDHDRHEDVPRDIVL